MRVIRNKPISGNLDTNADVVFFVSSSGHCSLDCHYCIVNPIVKHKPSLSLPDIEYLLDSVSGKCALAFSGKGDFFAGYRKNDEFLSRLLERDVDIGLDINGVMINEFPALSDAKLEKIIHINLTMHYAQLVNKNALRPWVNNARIIIQKERCQTFFMGTILSPKEEPIWDEALAFYEKEIFSETGQPIALIRDVLNWDSSFEGRLEILRSKYSNIVADTLQADFSQVFPANSDVLCPAGKAFFRIWNDGRIGGCPYVGELVDCGNAKMRTFSPRKMLYQCNQPRYCECELIGKLGRMQDANTGDFVTANSVMDSAIR